MPAPPFFQSAGRGDLVVCGGKRRTDGKNMGKPIRTRKEKLAGKGKHHAGDPNRTTKRKLAGKGRHDARLCCVVQVKKRGRGNPLI